MTDRPHGAILALDVRAARIDKELFSLEGTCHTIDSALSIIYIATLTRTVRQIEMWQASTEKSYADKSHNPIAYGRVHRPVESDVHGYALRSANG